MSAPAAQGGTLATRARATWPPPGGSGGPPAVPGFVESAFPALVSAAADGCLRARGGGGPGPAGGAARTAVVLVSRYGDRATAAAVARAVDGGTRLQPLLFFQSVPNAVAGRVAARWGLTGPVVCVSPAGDRLAAGRELAELLVADGDADEVLLVVADLGWSGTDPGAAEALLLAPAERTDEPPDRPPVDRPTDGRPDEPPVDRPTDEPPDGPPVDRPANRPADRSADHPADRPTDRPADRPTGRPADRPADQGGETA